MARSREIRGADLFLGPCRQGVAEAGREDGPGSLQILPESRRPFTGAARVWPVWP
ncbi:hypothetical protein GF1_08900 [Desulfolithobacter dissulfuricans]|uniref:Uncharacterized protein n=1 Tax=Desulfolithobacter dissulfuricans TaxID=2795293 RepID=A0A915U033_9BACT|nr:hypothetical protein GF1_08900 [Desulfolithobacter dissulfuricans]